MVEIAVYDSVAENALLKAIGSRHCYCVLRTIDGDSFFLERGGANFYLLH